MYWIDNHIEYQNILDERAKIQTELKTINIEIEKLLG